MRPRASQPVVIFSHGLIGKGFTVPAAHTARPTSEILTSGFVADLPYRGIPVYGPIGAAVLHAIEGMLQDALASRGHVQVEIPSLMRTEDLEAGEPIGPQFARKIIPTDAALKGYHLLTTPEMLFVREAAKGVLSHRDLPVRRSYTANFFRNMPTTRSLLVCRQFRIVGTVALESHENGVREALDAAVAASAEVLTELRVETEMTRQAWSNKLELFFPCAEGDKWVATPRGNAKMLSLAVGYQYAAGSVLPLRHRSASNRNSPVLIASYGLCSNRVLFSVFDANRDEQGFALPPAVRPFDAVVMAHGSESAGQALSLSSQLSRAGLRVGLDDRMAMATAERRRFAAFAGAAAVAVVTGDDVQVSMREDLANRVAVPARQAAWQIAALVRDRPRAAA
jgi:prolyl-tRNA synthetase